MTIAKMFEFESAHQLPDIECYGACRNLHGHTYKLTVEVEGEVNKYGWVINFKDLKKIVNETIIDKYDHSNLNDYIEVPTAENLLIKMKQDLSPKLMELGVRLYSLKLYETSNSYAYLKC